MKTLRILIAIAIVALTFGCGGGGGDAADAGPDIERGEALYNRATLGAKSAEGCVSCHNYDESEGEADKAPYTKGTATRAATRIAGMSAEEYLRESLANPDAYIVEGYLAGDMYAGWTEDLSQKDFDDIIAYLLTEI